MNIKDVLKLKNDQPVEGCYVISAIKLKPFTNKDGSFLSFALQDRTGKAYGKIWDDAEDYVDKFEEDSVVKVKGLVNIYNGKVSVIVRNVKVVSEGEYNFEDFVPTSPNDPEEMYDELVKLLRKNVKQKDMKNLLESYLSDESFLHKFKRWPGGKGDVHHAYMHGLLEHTLGVVRMCDIYVESFKDEIDGSLLVLGAFLHDLGKIEHYKFNMSIGVTDVGRLHEHTSLGYGTFLKNLKNVDMEVETMLMLRRDLGHLILSHHGDQYGVVKPMTKEAVLLSKADVCDSDVNHISKLLKDSNEDWSGWDQTRERMFFKGESYDD